MRLVGGAEIYYRLVEFLYLKINYKKEKLEKIIIALKKLICRNKFNKEIKYLFLENYKILSKETEEDIKIEAYTVQN